MKNKKVLLFSLAALLSGSTLFGQWKLVGNSLNGTQKLGSTNNFPLDFFTNNVKRMSLTSTGNLRFNSDQLSIQFPNPGATPKPMMFWYESGTKNNPRMVMAYSPGFPNFGLQTDGFNKLNFTDGSIAALSVDMGLHNVGVGTTNPGIFKLKIIHDNNIANDGGLAIENSTAPGIEWEFFAGGGFTPLNLLRDKAFMGQFSFPSGQYLALSDERLKTNIRQMQPVLGKINQLKPSTYQFKKATDKGDYDGFIAQDVMKIFPSLVTHTVNKESNTDVYLMNYSGFGVIAIKGIQELMKQNEAKDSAIASLQKQIDELKAIVLKGNQSNAAAETNLSASFVAASLEKNTPNPFTNTTVIQYNIPQRFSAAQLLISDNSGKQIKQIKITNSGRGNVRLDASSLVNGTYTYSLVVDGKLIDSKQMMVAK